MTAPTTPDLPPITPPSIERGDAPVLALVAHLSALLALADARLTSEAAFREARFMVIGASAEQRQAAAVDLDAEAAGAPPDRARWLRAAAAYVRSLDAGRP